MKSNVILITAVALATSACGQKASESPAANTAESTTTTANTVANDFAAAPATANQAEPPKTSLPEPKGPIDPKSVEAAGQVVQHYGALIEQKKWTTSRDYWGDAGSAKAFEANFRTYADVHLEIGDLGEPEGAAGSIFVSMPVFFYGEKNGGGDYRRAAEITLRRVNDVDGSTEAQRRWHIERIDWK